MELLITAGAMREEIDEVRAIANHSTGALGCRIAEAFARLGGTDVETIHYVCDEQTPLPRLPCVHPVFARGAAQTGQAVTRLLCEHPIAAMVHAMAVSDYTVRGVATVETLATALAARLAGRADNLSAQALQKAIADSLAHEALLPRSGKYSSQLEAPLLALTQTPKLIDTVKTASPRTLLVGFKLLDGVPQAELLRAAGALLRRSGCNYVLANDLQSIRAGCHTGYLLGRDGACAEARGKEAVAALIARTVLTTLGKGKP